jgi:outer membrane autotransporter protein
VLKGSGTISGDLTLGNATLAPGFSPGSLTVSGNLNMTASSVLNVELGGTAQGSGYDYLNVLGTANLAGTLNVTGYNGYVASGGTSYRFMNFASTTGGFAAVNLPVGWNLSLVSGSSYLDLLSTSVALPAYLASAVAMTPDAVFVMLNRVEDTTSAADIAALPRQQLVSVDSPVQEEACP